MALVCFGHKAEPRRLSPKWPAPLAVASALDSGVDSNLPENNSFGEGEKELPVHLLRRQFHGSRRDESRFLVGSRCAVKRQDTSHGNTAVSHYHFFSTADVSQISAEPVPQFSDIDGLHRVILRIHG
jgi:hypothetical protein